MKRSSSESEAKRAGSSGPSSSQRLAAAGVQAIEAHTRVRKFAERLGEELEELEEDITLLNEGASEGLDPEDPMVVAVEKAASTMRSVTASMAAVTTVPESPATFAAGTGERAPSTKLGVGPPAKPDKPVVKTKLGVAPPPKRAPETPETDDE